MAITTAVPCLLVPFVPSLRYALILAECPDGHHHGLEHILRAQPRENADRVWLFARASTMKKSGESAADWWQHEFDKPPAACAFLNAGAFGSQLAAVLAKAVQPHVKDTTSSEIAGLACDLTDGSSLLEEAIAKS